MGSPMAAPVVAAPAAPRYPARSGYAADLPPPNAAHGEYLVLAYLAEMAVRSCGVSSQSSTPRPLHAGLLEELRTRTAQQG